MRWWKGIRHGLLHLPTVDVGSCSSRTKDPLTTRACVSCVLHRDRDIAVIKSFTKDVYGLDYLQKYHNQVIVKNHVYRSTVHDQVSYCKIIGLVTPFPVHDVLTVYSSNFEIP